MRSGDCRSGALSTREHGIVHGQRPLRGPRPGELRRPLDSATPEFQPHVRNLEEFHHRSGERLERSGIAQDSRVPGHFRHGRAARSDDRASSRHGFEDGKTEPFDDGGKDQRDRAVHQRDHVLVADEAGERHTIANPQSPGQSAQLVARIAATGHDQAEIRPLARADGECPQGRREVLVRPAVPETEEVRWLAWLKPVRGLRKHRVHDAVVHDLQERGIEPEILDRARPAVPGTGDDPVRAADGVPHGHPAVPVSNPSCERRNKTAPNQLPVLEPDQIVERDDDARHTQAERKEMMQAVKEVEAEARNRTAELRVGRIPRDDDLSNRSPSGERRPAVRPPQHNVRVVGIESRQGFDEMSRVRPETVRNAFNRPRVDADTCTHCVISYPVVRTTGKRAALIFADGSTTESRQSKSIGKGQGRFSESKAFQMQKEDVITIVKAASRPLLREFVELPYSMYPRSSHWVPPLRRDEYRRFSPRHNPFLEHATITPLLARANGQTVGRVAAIEDRLHNDAHAERTVWFGFLEARDSATAAALLGAVEKWGRDRGANAVRGPANPSLNESVGLLVDGFDEDPYLLMPFNPPQYASFLERSGYRKVKDLFAWTIDLTVPLGDRVDRVARRAARRHAIGIRPADLRAFERDLAFVQEIYRAAWSNNWGFVAPTEAEIRQLAKELRPVLDPEILLIAEIAGRPVGCALAFPDFNQVLKRMNGRLLPFGLVHFLRRRSIVSQARVALLGVLPEYHRSGLYPLLVAELHRRGAARGYRRAELSWTLEDNVAINAGIEAAGGRHYKTYRVYEKPLG
jgi:hypothetical protein